MLCLCLGRQAAAFFQGLPRPAHPRRRGATHGGATATQLAALDERKYEATPL